MTKSRSHFHCYSARSTTYGWRWASPRSSSRGGVAHARVTEVEQQQVVYKSGIEFVEPSEQVGAAIDAFVTELRATQGPNPDDS